MTKEQIFGSFMHRVKLLNFLGCCQWFEHVLYFVLFFFEISYANVIIASRYRITIIKESQKRKKKNIINLQDYYKKRRDRDATASLTFILLNLNGRCLSLDKCHHQQKRSADSGCPCPRVTEIHTLEDGLLPIHRVSIVLVDFTRYIIIVRTRIYDDCHELVHHLRNFSGLPNPTFQYSFQTRNHHKSFNAHVLYVY